MLRGLCLALTLLAGQAAAQVAPSDVESAILTVVPDRLFSDSRAGKTATARFEAASRALVAENRKIEAELEAEERALTDRRAVTPPEEFRRLADAFDTRVDAIRDRQDAKSRDLTRLRDADRQAFFQATIPILAAMMEESGAVAILDRGSVFLSFDLIDVTGEAIQKLDAELGDGATVYPDPDAASAP